jgi:hypothetical protein
LISAGCFFFFSVGHHIERRFICNLLRTQRKFNSTVVSDLLDLVQGVVYRFSVFGHHLDLNRRMFFGHISDFPANDSELNVVFLAYIDARIETFCVK